MPAPILLAASPLPTAPASGLSRQLPRDLRSACLELEGLFLSLLLERMRATVPRSGLLSTGAAGDLFDSLWVQEIAHQTSVTSPPGRPSPLRLADLLAASLSRNGHEDPPTPLKPAALPAEDPTRRPPVRDWRAAGRGGGQCDEDHE